MKVKLLSRVELLATPWTAAYQALPSMGFSRQEYWSGVPLPSLRERIVELKITEICSPGNTCLGDKLSVNKFKKILQPSPQFNLGTFPLPPKRNPIPIFSHSSFLPRQPHSSPRQSIIDFVCMDLFILDISYNRGHL